MNLMNRTAAQARAEEKEKQLLQFLKAERYTTQDIVQQLLGLSTRQAAHKTLKRLEAQELVKQAQIDVGIGRPKTVWGLSVHGAMMAAGPDDDLQAVRGFEPSKVTPSSMAHHHMVQLVRVRAEAAGWTNWSGEGVRVEGFKAPDGLATSPSGVAVAFEVERTLKHTKRYPDILSSHLRAVSAGHYARVFYISETEVMREKLRLIFSQIDSVTFKGQPYAVTDRHKARLSFFTIDEAWEK